MQDPIYAKIESTPRPTLFAASGFVLLAAIGLWVSTLLELLLPNAGAALINALYYLPFTVLPVGLYMRRRPGLGAGMRLNAPPLMPTLSAALLGLLSVYVASLISAAWAAGLDALGLAEQCGETLIIHIEKALYSYTGVYPALVQEFATMFGHGATLINREDDAADRGLRTSKLQYGPAKLASKYQVKVQNELMRHVEAIPELKTARLTLTALREEDIPAYNALVLDAERNALWGYDDVGGLGGPVEERSFYEVAKRDFENRLAVNFAVRLEGKLIGEAVLYNFDGRGGAELGCRIDKAYAGHGYGVEAFAAAADWGLYRISLNRVVAKCFKENTASYKMLSACMRKKGEDEKFFYFEKVV